MRQKVFPGGRVWPPQPPRHRGGWVWGVGFYPFSGGQLPNFQGKSPGIFSAITPRSGTF
ncbi:mobile element protein [Microcystis aeruginosa NIES-44]|uniref:Mobile element protein n=1 Tax=Microcystis aeruginosa NIES-44 TaxID=449439 RepID=A0A0A1VW16_MICAE|nr:mobile element protein [Microcystis aeruginosa NIES-44]